MSNTKTNIQDIYTGLLTWITEHEFKSKDVCDVTSLNFYQLLQNINYKYKAGKYIYAPFYRAYKQSPDLIRSLTRLKPMDYPQAYSLIISALTRSGHLLKNEERNQLVSELLQKLIDSNSAEKGYYAWGQPYKWFSRKRIPAHTPRTTVSTQAGHAFLDAFTMLQDEKYLEIAKGVGRFFIEKMKYNQDSDGDICFPYTTHDNYHVHNANVLAAAYLTRLAMLTGEDNYFEIAEHSFRFTVKHQNQDGSWYYWAPPDKLMKKIDHYHTGFVLESLKIGEANWKGSFPYSESMKIGMEFYLNELFEEKMIPKMFPHNIYPVDIQSCAQAIITIGEVMPVSEEKSSWLNRIFTWTLENMYDEENSYFYYRKYRNRTDKTPYLRWGQSWMLKALTYIY